ncbi:ankyrin-3-like [Acanthaster planci]|uniref:Ankyrin-3-like n=1 Tax=Acanthaster planci TaxID=133434 RepID=A0A8B7XFY7_ACAPL|nr:ankyrin-3-like [Acanthaster planci]
MSLWCSTAGDLVDLINSDCSSSRFRRFLRHCQNPNETVGAMKLTALHHAVFKQRSDCVNCLLQHHVDVNVQDCCGYSPVHVAAKHGLVEMLEQLVQPGTEADTNRTDAIGLTPLSLALQEGHHACAEVLLRHGADPNFYHKHIGYEVHRVPLDAPECLETLLRYGADPESRTPKGLTALHAAVEVGHLKFVEILLTLGCDVHAWTAPRTPGRHRRNALQLAIIGNELDITRCLLAYGADPNSRDQQGNTPLHHASAHRGVPFIQLLLDYGADIHALNDRQYQPLHRACSAGSEPDILKLLLRSGADTDALTSTDDTPLHCLLSHYINVLNMEEVEDRNQLDQACQQRVLAFINNGGRFTISTARDNFRSVLSMLPLLTAFPQTIQLLVEGANRIDIQDINDLVFSLVQEPLKSQL